VRRAGCSATPAGLFSVTKSGVQVDQETVLAKPGTPPVGGTISSPP
jgi:hypothetical protein